MDDKTRRRCRNGFVFGERKTRKTDGAVAVRSTSFAIVLPECSTWVRLSRSAQNLLAVYSVVNFWTSLYSVVNSSTLISVWRVGIIVEYRKIVIGSMGWVSDVVFDEVHVPFEVPL